MQAMNKENDNILLDFENVTNLVTSIVVLLKQKIKSQYKLMIATK